MALILSEKVRIGVSACNFGALVRYNRRGWDRIGLLAREKDAFIWTPVCPEAMSGLGVPREPMKLTNGTGEDFWQGKAKAKDKKGRDVSDLLRAGTDSCLEALKRARAEAFVFMEGSPSCGVYRTTLKDGRLGKPPGIFGSRLLKEEYFLIPAADLDSPIRWWDWRRRLHAFIWLKRAEIKGKQELYAVWHNYKFICQEICESEARNIGRELAGLPDGFSDSAFEEWRKRTLLLLRRPVPEKRIRAALAKHCAYFKKFQDSSASGCLLPRLTSSKRELADALLEMESKAFSSGIDFATVPVLYRGR